MTKTQQLGALAAMSLILGSSAFMVSSNADDSADEPKQTYRTLLRFEVDQMGGRDKSQLQPIRDTEALRKGLNLLADEGWELVAVEGGRSLPVTGPAGTMVHYPPVYIFKRSQR